MAWVYLLVAGILEILWATALKYSEGYSKLAPAAVTIAGQIRIAGLKLTALR